MVMHGRNEHLIHTWTDLFFCQGLSASPAGLAKDLSSTLEPGTTTERYEEAFH